MLLKASALIVNPEWADREQCHLSFPILQQPRTCLYIWQAAADPAPPRSQLLWTRDSYTVFHVMGSGRTQGTRRKKSLLSYIPPSWSAFANTHMRFRCQDTAPRASNMHGTSQRKPSLSRLASTLPSLPSSFHSTRETIARWQR